MIPGQGFRAAVLLVFLASSGLRAETTAPPIPHPDLSQLEPAVATQMRALRENLEAILAQPEASPLEIRFAYDPLCKVYLAHHLRDAAEACFHQALEHYREIEWIYYLGVLYQEAGELDRAAFYLGQAVQQAPNWAAFHVRLGQVELEAGRLEAASSAFQAALRGKSTTAAAHFGLGRVAAAEGDFEAAVEHFTATLSLQPEAGVVHYPLAMAYRRLGRIDEARAQLQLRSEAGGEEREVRFGDVLVARLEGMRQGGSGHLLERASIALREERWADAEKLFTAAREMDPESTKPLGGLAMAKERQGDDAGAVEVYRRLLELAPKEAHVHFSLGRLLLRMEHLEDAEAHLREGIRLQPDWVNIHLALSRVLLAADRPEEAQEVLAEAMEHKPNYPEIHLALAEGALSTGECDQATNILERGLGLAPDAGELVHLLARVLATCPRPEDRDGPRALQLALAVYQALPSAEHGETVAMALAELARFPEAVEWQTRALDAARDGDLATRGSLSHAAIHEVEDAPHAERRLAEVERRLELYRRGEPCRSPWKD